MPPNAGDMHVSRNAAPPTYLVQLLVNVARPCDALVSPRWAWRLQDQLGHLHGCEGVRGEDVHEGEGVRGEDVRV